MAVALRVVWGWVYWARVVESEGLSSLVAWERSILARKLLNVCGASAMHALAWGPHLVLRLSVLLPAPGSIPIAMRMRWLTVLSARARAMQAMQIQMPTPVDPKPLTFAVSSH